MSSEKSSAMIHVAHILVAQKYEAEDLLRKLSQGESFEAMARKFSTCSSARNGGDLGEVEKRRLDEDFLLAAEKLEVGAISSAVRSRFGYHIIKKLA